MPKVKVAMVGSGFAAELHMSSYRRVYGVDVEVAAVVSPTERADRFAAHHGIPRVGRDIAEVLADPTIDVVDIATPAALHAPMVIAAMAAGKHVICEKPFTGYFGRPGDAEPVGRAVAKAVMYERVLEDIAAMTKAIRASGKLFCYAENWVYAPSVQKTAEFLRATKDKILFMKAEESHSGSHSPHAASWAMSGGGALIRQGCHPLATVLYLKRVEAQARGEAIGLRDVTADVGTMSPTLGERERTYIQARPVDVEDWGMLSLTFTDGTKATVFAGDMILGGVRNLVETFTTGGVIFANMAPNNHVVSYQTDDSRLGSVYVTEKVDRKTGWQLVCVEEEATRGYSGEMQDFMECITKGREPIAGVDLAAETMKAQYAAYWAADEGRRIVF